MANYGIFGKIIFETPPLVEGVTPVFFIPVPESMQNFPWVMNLDKIAEVTQNGFGLPVTLTVITTWFIIGLIFLTFYFGTKNLKIIPGKFQTILESLYGAFDMITGQMLNTWRKKYFSYISSLLLFIILSNIVAFFPVPKVVKGIDGIIRISPALRTPTADLNTTVGLAILTAIIFTAVSLKTNGLRNYIKGFLDPIFLMAPLNIIGEISKPVNISLRLFGNMFAGSVIIGLLYMATTSYGPLAMIVAPLHLYFDLFSGVVQGFVFSMLTMVYISGAYGDREYDEKTESISKEDLQKEAV
ncbi:F0F1 ATP synthase subunit A [Fusobacterium sp. PH5-44]|uniref:F0F1 ATP synthase subunit A n=1 Tax=unclassified Fusobacterium TaxID=2648384 RepID=UPI003D1BC290